MSCVHAFSVTQWQCYSSSSNNSSYKVTESVIPFNHMHSPTQLRSLGKSLRRWCGQLSLERKLTVKSWQLFSHPAFQSTSLNNITSKVVYANIWHCQWLGACFREDIETMCQASSVLQPNLDSGQNNAPFRGSASRVGLGDFSSRNVMFSVWPLRSVSMW